MPDIDASIVLNVLGLRDLAVYGFRSWMIQGLQRPYEVILNLFAPTRELFDPLIEGKNPNCEVRIIQHPEPNYFNVSAANNYGLHVSRGRYVVFANADVIYPGNFLTRALTSLEQRDLCYAIAARVNLLPEHGPSFKPPIEYQGEHAFDDFHRFNRAPGVTTWSAISPWMLRRDIAFAVGGFDPQVIMAEDRDFDMRTAHYLRRTGLQHAPVSFYELRGYHLWHAPSGLFDTWPKSKAIIEPREVRLREDPDSKEDVLPTKLADEAALLAEIKNTEKPPLLMGKRQNLSRRVFQRAKDVLLTARHGR
jgi:hypothetical protein